MRPRLTGKLVTHLGHNVQLRSVFRLLDQRAIRGDCASVSTLVDIFFASRMRNGFRSFHRTADRSLRISNKCPHWLRLASHRQHRCLVFAYFSLPALAFPRDNFWHRLRIHGERSHVGASWVLFKAALACFRDRNGWQRNRGSHDVICTVQSLDDALCAPC
jgi:hypothetical protein